MNKYDLEHVCTGHAQMSKEQWQQCYRDAWTRYYTPEHVETILRRAHASYISMSRVGNVLTAFAGSTDIEDVHPLQVGVVRRKVRTHRRFGMPLENPLIFYPRRGHQLLKSLMQWGTLALRYRRMRKRITNDPASRGYMDEAMQPLVGEHADNFVEVYADKIPKTHGAPAQRPAAAAASAGV